MIVFRGVTKRLGQRLVLDGVSLRALPGEVTALVGPSGAGKSMLLRCLSGLVNLDAGEIRVAGLRLEDVIMPGRVVGVAMDVNCVHPGRRVPETLRLALMANRMPTARLDRLLARAELKGLNCRVRECSRDQLQRLAITVAMAGAPSALVLDEPLTYLDAASWPWFETLLADYLRRGGSVLLTAQQVDDLQGLASHVVEMADGRVVSGGLEEPEAATAPTARAAGSPRVSLPLATSVGLAVAR